MGATLRAEAVRALLRVLRDDLTLTQAVDEASRECADPRDAALLKEICYGTLRWKLRLEALLAHMLERPLKSADLDVKLALLIGLYQLAYLRVPPHAAVRETVEACRVLGKEWAAGLVNAVLRRFDRERPALEAAVADEPTARYAHPQWFIEELKRDWPEHWEQILDAGNARPPLTLRVNRRRAIREDYLARLAAEGIAARACRHAADGVVLEEARDVSLIPGFAEGLCSVQDEGAQLAADLVDATASMRVLDACAAPGGKTCHLLERNPVLANLMAVEQDSRRARRIDENLSRLGLSAEVKVADATVPATWWDGKPYERILLDAPCSASGVVRRHPDVKARRTRAEVAQAAGLQARLLAALWPLLAPRGKLVYVTCSVFRRENVLQLESFLAGQGDAEALPLQVEWGVPAGPGRQVLTGEDGMDGFYYACVRKRE